MFNPLQLIRGRIGRKNYVLGLLLSFIIMIFVGAGVSEEENLTFYDMFALLIVLAGAVFFLILHVRRLHDMNHSGLYLFLFFIPLVNMIILISACFTKGSEKANKYGEKPDPKTKFLDALFNNAS